MTPATVSLLTTVEAQLVPVAVTLITGCVGALTYWAQKHFAIANTAAAKSIEANANTVLQAALANGAGDVIAQIKSGAIDLNDAAGLRRAAVAAAAMAAARVPEAVSLLQPAAGMLADMLTAKVHLAVAPVVVAPPSPPPASSVPPA